MSEIWKRGCKTVLISLFSIVVVIMMVRVSDDAFLKGGSDSVIQDVNEIPSYIRGLRDYKGKANLSTKVSLRFDIPCNDYRQGALRDYYNTVADQDKKIYGNPGTCWSSAILSAYLSKNPASYGNYKKVAAEILKNAILRGSIYWGLPHSESRSILNEMFDLHKVQATCKSWSTFALGGTTTGALYYDKIVDERIAGNVCLFSVPGHEMVAAGYCTVQVQWKEGTKIKTKFEDMILVCDTWHDRENVYTTGKPKRYEERVYSYFPVREMAYGLYYNLSVVKNK